MATNVTTSAETNLIKATDLKKVREVDFVTQFAHNSLAKLVEALGVTRKIAMEEGTTMYLYTVTGTAGAGSVPEGEIIPLSKYAQSKTAVGEITLKKWRKAASAESIKKSGYDTAVRDTDNALLRDIQKSIRADMFTFLNGTITGSTTVSGEKLQDVLADTWAQLQIKFEDDTAEAVHFVNPLDISDYLKTAQISVQTAFGMNYVEDFLGLGTVIMSSLVTRGTVISTAKSNIIMYYLTMNGDIAQAFNLTADETGFIGIKSGYTNEERAQIESLVMSGIQFLVEYAAGVVKGTITGTLAELTVASAAGTASGDTAITVSGYTVPTGGGYVYKVTDDEIVVRRGDDASGWTDWDGDDEITAATGKIITVAVADSDDKILAAGHATVVAHA